jgi:hypothetical protein
MTRDLFAREALAQIPKILTLQDRNPHSPTYGCFDRNFWQYKIIDFPSGMAQEFVLALTLAYQTHLPDNPFYDQPALKQWVVAGIRYAAQSMHPDGSCDDYFPFERAGGAAAFSLLACVESYLRLGLKDAQILAFFSKRADWLAHHQESGRLTNHQALIVLCLELLSRLLKTDRWDKAKSQRLEQVFDWQNEEGWFQEYEGCDPGYHTLTISCLARLHQLNADQHLKAALIQESLIKAVRLAAQFSHPDGSYGGEYTSRNTYNFFPHGFELIGRWFPEALAINDRFLTGLASGKAACYADDHIIGHHTWNYLLAWQDFVSERLPLTPHPEGQVWLKQAKLLIDRRQGQELYLALNKGGAFKLFSDGQLVASDTQLSLQVQVGNKLKNAVGHLVSDYTVDVTANEIVIRGHLGWAKQKQMTPLNLMILRLVMLSIGRFYPNLIRTLLQKLLIVGKNDAPFQFIRRLQWTEAGLQSQPGWQVTDELRAQHWHNVISAGIGVDQTSIYVVMSRTYQVSQLQTWLDLTDQVKQLQPNEPLLIERWFGDSHPT